MSEVIAEMVDYPIKWAACRSDGHLWMHRETVVDSNATDVVIRTLHCPRHDGDRLDTINRNTGEIIRRRYSMPKGYYIQGHGRIPRPTFRVALIHEEVS